MSIQLQFIMLHLDYYYLLMMIHHLSVICTHNSGSVGIFDRLAASKQLQGQASALQSVGAARAMVNLVQILPKVAGGTTVSW